ncbi:sodium:proton antiporter [Chitinilyticum piscinae]|uniref:Sodium:proton antiporter n=1 Tax=Chitinilyticum piscinae TaxID=2866724 RepID=A0A8J7FHU3_9NEIS|nr:sodium:proton antiporter [Chitinilyticum piscinae]MBE9608042.1 sodium:proton antiporter [Chitinilyticum piscinae]
MHFALKALSSALFFLLPALAHAAALDGSQLSLWWILPFAGILLSIALCPLFLPHFWHLHFGKVAAFWGLAFLLPCAILFGGGTAGTVVIHALVEEYIPFIILLFALYTISGGILIWGNLHGSPLLNTGLLALGAILASLMGTTGAAMLLIRPLIKANDNRRHNVHVIVFFIFIVANIGGGLTPIGDPPLFLGFLKGVGFFWTLQHMLPLVAFACAVLLAVFFAIDSYYFRKEGVLPFDKTPDSPIKIHGKRNIPLLLAAVACVVLSGIWNPGITLELGPVHWQLQNLARDLALIGLGLLSLRITPKPVRAGNDFSWGPIQEVAKLFAGIFVAMAPAIAILRAGEQGALSGLVALVFAADGAPRDHMFFWMSGSLSAFLDNAPTYLVFFNLAHGDAIHLMHQMPSTLLAISAGSVFMGAMSYIGNAPNFMVKAVAEDRGIRMPSFFGYMAWSLSVLLPLFLIITWVFFHPYGGMGLAG